MSEPRLRFCSYEVAAMAKPMPAERAVTLEELLRDARRNQPKIDWVTVRDGYRGVEALEPIAYCMRDYQPGDKFVCLKQVARWWEDQHRVKIVSGGHLDCGQVKLGGRSVLVLWPWYDVPIHDHDWFVRVGVRVATKEVIERFDLSALTVGFEFFTDYRSVREVGFCVGESLFREPSYGPAEAPLVLFNPQIPE